MTGEYPLIAERWVEAPKLGIYVTVEQHNNEIVANCTYTKNGVEVDWRANGTISKDGHIGMHLVCLTPTNWPTQTRLRQLDPDGKTIRLRANISNGVTQNPTWRMDEP